MLIAVFLSAALPASAQDPSLSLSGHVRSVHDSSAVPTALVSLVVGDSVVARTSAGFEGQFEFISIPSGAVEIRAEHFAFETTQVPYTHRPDVEAVTVWIGRPVAEDEIPFGVSEARRDLEAGRVHLLEFALIDITHYYVPASCFERVDYLFRAAIVDIERSFGYSRKDITEQFKDAGVRWRAVHLGVERYNAEVERHLTIRNGARWRDAMDRKCAKSKRDAIVRGCPELRGE